MRAAGRHCWNSSPARRPPSRTAAAPRELGGRVSLDEGCASFETRPVGAPEVEVFSLMPSRTALILRRRAQRGVSKDARSRCTLKQRQLWPKWLWVLLAVASIALFGGSTIAPAAEISDGIVKIGPVPHLSGPYAENTGQGSAAAAKMAASDFGGKVLGTPIELVVADHHNSADRAAAI